MIEAKTEMNKRKEQEQRIMLMDARGVDDMSIYYWGLTRGENLVSKMLRSIFYDRDSGNGRFMLHVVTF